MIDTQANRIKTPPGAYVILLLTIAISALLMWSMTAWLMSSMDDLHERTETRTRVEYVRSYQRGCPGISGRLSEYIADGRVTDEEDEVIDTIIAQQRALPGGLSRCRKDVR